MSSGTRPESYAGARVAAAMSERAMKANDGIGTRGANLGMGPRQILLNWRWAWYRALHYETRRIDWDGHQRASDPIDHEAIATAAFLPPGSYDAGETLPLKFRKPTAPYQLVKVIVDRFTSLLFSERRHPQISVPGDPDTEDYLSAMADAARFWSRMNEARAFGGAQGTAVAMYKFVDGVPGIEVFDPRWCYPTWKDRSRFLLSRLEVRFIFHDQRRDPETGNWVEVPLWSRRVIDEAADTTWSPVEVGDGAEPAWDRLPSQSVSHGLGECPVRWCQNLPCGDSADGDPDALGIYDMVEAIDGLLAQAHRSIQYSGDPTLKVITDAPLASVRVGSDHAIKLPSGSSADFLESHGDGARSAVEMAMKLRDLVLEVAECVLEHQDKAGSSAKTATEVERDYSAMIGRADRLREQYAECLVKPLLTGLANAAARLSRPALDPATGQLVRGQIKLPPRLVDGKPTERALGQLAASGGAVHVELKWPGYFEPGLADANLATGAAMRAFASKLVDQDHAAQFVAPYFRVEDVPGMLEKIKGEAAAQQAQLEQMALSGGGGGGFRSGGFGGGGGGGGDLGGVGAE